MPGWLAALALLATAVAAAAADWRSPPWRRPAAEVRLFAGTAQTLPHTLAVPLPADTGDWADAEAFGGELPLPCRPVFDRGRLVAAEVVLDAAALAAVASGRSPPGALELYLFRERQERPAVEFPLLPVTLRAAAEKAMARPANGREYRQYARQRPALGWRRELPGLPDAADAAALATLHVAEHQLRLQCSMLWRVEAETSVQFAIANPVCGAWFLFYDDQAVFSWGECASADGLPVSAPVACAPGLHRLDFAVMAEPGEAWPELRFRERQREGLWQPLAAANLFSVNAALTLCCETRRDLLSPGVRLEPLNVFAFQGTDTWVSLVRVADFSQPWANGPVLTRWLTVAGRERELPATGAVIPFPGHAVNRVSLRVTDVLGSERTLEVPFRLEGTGAQGVRAEFALRGLPLFEPAAGHCRVRYEVSLTPAWQSTIEEHVEVVRRQCDAGGRITAVAATALPRSLSARELDLPLELPPGSRLELSLELGGLPVCPPLRLYPVTPAGDLNFRPSADQLRYADGFGILRRPVEPAGAVAPWVKAPPPVRELALVLVDDFVANAPHFQEPATAADWTWGDPGRRLRVTHLPLAGRVLAGQHPVLDKYPALAQALAARPAAIVWAAGVADLRAGMDQRDYRSQLVFVLEACRARGQPLVLVTPPVDGTVAAAAVRVAALAVKELGLKYGVPVADLYSASLRHGGLGPYFGLEGQGESGSATPNAAGRRWCLERLAGTVAAWAWPEALTP